MTKKECLVFGMFLSFVILFASLVSSACCEQTTSGAWCQNAPLSQCKTTGGLLSSSTSCNMTSYCKTGTCVDNKDGKCLPNTPQRVCESEGGYWSEKTPDELPQCSYGCCFYGDQSAFTTQTGCGTLASNFGLNSTYRDDITSELECLGAAGLGEKGACVFEQAGTRNCRMLTKGECNALTKGNENINFNEGYLCTAEFLGTVCKPRGGTTCVDGKSEVYFKDTCGNIANIYDSSRLNDPVYWTNMFSKEESCGWNDLAGSANSPSCGNCEYLLGSICEDYVKGENTKPNYGGSVCADLSCDFDVNDNGKIDVSEKGVYKHGEKWCSTNNNLTGIRTGASVLLTKTTYTKEQALSLYVPGTEQYVYKCYNGEVLTESCTTGEWRNKICKQVEVNGISNAKCVANAWRNCLDITKKEDCVDNETNDCKWIEGYSLLKDDKGRALGKDEDGKIGTCVSRVPPANNFWDSEGDAADMCGLASEVTIVEYKVPLTVNIKNMDGNNKQDRAKRDAYCTDNCAALDTKGSHKQWLNARLEVCASLGDCSASTNYIGEFGDKMPEDLIVYKFVRKANKLESAAENLQEELNE